MQATSAESNVLSIPAALGLKTKVLTTFVKDSPIAKFIQATCAAAASITRARSAAAAPGATATSSTLPIAALACCGPRVANDRAGEVGRTLNVKDFDLNRLFVEEGVEILHVSGLIAALSPETSEFCLALARAARRRARRFPST